MTQKILLPIIAIILIYIIFNINYQINDKTAIGIYVNKNFENPICCVESPHVPDTLTLNKNGTFYSKYYGNGKYKLGSGFETKIELNSTDIGKELTHKTYFENKICAKPRIILNADMNHYYEKIE